MFVGLFGIDRENMREGGREGGREMEGGCVHNIKITKEVNRNRNDKILGTFLTSVLWNVCRILCFKFLDILSHTSGSNGFPKSYFISE